ncbi:RRNA adenine N(6)-methyltransferase [Aphelenchoides besseyi]|nr:RRNA adenine N(6)-methyltransferase [Aphelenchoides besseyi]KAI6222092.1 RRNA adenine N(6)-methyltransferase [Aphelenchoides besseyi]
MTTQTLRLPPLPSLRDFIHMYQLKARKVLSQNYIMDMGINRKIVRHAEIQSGSSVVEIGPGPGGITRAILERNPKRLDVVEIDRQFRLANAVPEKLFIHHADILKTNIEDIWNESKCEKHQWWEEEPKLHVIGNLPFNIASPLIIRLLHQMSERRGPWAFGRTPLTLTFQLEVARRICAPIDCDERTRISIVSQYISDPKLVHVIPGLLAYDVYQSESSRCFVPKPQVDVGVVRFVPRERPLIPAAFKVVEKVCRNIFHYRQKYVVHCVRTLYPKDLSRKMADDLLHACRVNPQNTSYELGMDEFADMCLYYEQQCREIPGLFAYNHYGEGHETLEELIKKPNALPPVYEAQQSPDLDRGLSLADFASTAR